jgi:hypothetical protein
MKYNEAGLIEAAKRFATLAGKADEGFSKAEHIALLAWVIGNVAKANGLDIAPMKTELMETLAIAGLGGNLSQFNQKVWPKGTAKTAAAVKYADIPSE